MCCLHSPLAGFKIQHVYYICGCLMWIRATIFLFHRVWDPCHKLFHPQLEVSYQIKYPQIIMKFITHPSHGWPFGPFGGFQSIGVPLGLIHDGIFHEISWGTPWQETSINSPSRLSFYIQARAEALRDRIVDFQGEPEVISHEKWRAWNPPVSSFGWWFNMVQLWRNKPFTGFNGNWEFMGI